MNNHVLTISEVADLTTLSKGTIYNYIKSGVLPSPRRLGPRRVGYCVSDIQDWLGACIADDAGADADVASSPATPQPRSQVVSIAATAKMLSVSKATVYNYIKSDILPPPLRLGPRRVGYRLADIEAWLASRGQDVDQG